MTDTARRAAANLLLRWESEGSFANLLVDGARLASMEERDRALTVALFYGTVERILTLDHYIGTLAARPAAGLDPYTRALCRLGLYQLLFTEIPAHAAVAETVALGRHRGERGLLNGILRRVADGEITLAPPDRAKNLARHLSLAYSIPVPTVRYFLSRLGECECEALLAAFNRRPPLTLRANTLHTSRDALCERLNAAGHTASPDPRAPHGVLLSAGASVPLLPGFSEGDFYVQDTASQLAAALLDPQAGDTVLDLCACPGGKSFAAALAMGDRGRVISRDIHESKLTLITGGAARLGLTSVQAEVWDATRPDPALCGKVDRVIADVPCSGLGVIAKKPDLRYRGLASLPELCALSPRILDAGAEALRVGGVMVFSTCTLTKEENEDTVAAFLSRHPDFTAEDFTLGDLSSEGGMLTLWPHRHGTDGFFMAKLRRL